ncbi:MAG: hypothetical protein ABEK75_07030 [Salinibacter sp.]
MGVYVPSVHFDKVRLPTISNLQIWLIAGGLIAVDLALFMFPVVPVLAAYVLVVRPPWFKDFIDDVYDR